MEFWRCRTDLKKIEQNTCIQPWQWIKEGEEWRRKKNVKNILEVLSEHPNTKRNTLSLPDYLLLSTKFDFIVDMKRLFAQMPLARCKSDNNGQQSFLHT